MRTERKERRVTEMTEKSLIHLILSDPEKGISAAIDRYGNTVKAVCANVLRGYTQEDIEEAWGETFYRLWKCANGFDFEKNTSLRTYIGTIARNVAIDTQRSRRAVRETPYEACAENEALDGIFGASDADTEADALRRVSSESVWAALDEMAEPTRSVFMLRYGHGLAVKEIAKQVGISAKQVENTLARKKGILRVALAERGIDGYEDL
jgi:RNA polymerase sigma-70 factor (ECF subfamily)